MIRFLALLKPRRQTRRHHPELPQSWSRSNWADLPTYHPRRDEDALH